MTSATTKTITSVNHVIQLNNSQDQSATPCEEQEVMKPQSQPLNLTLASKPRQQEKISNSENCYNGVTTGWKVKTSAILRSDPTEDYKMSAKERGTCLIINNVEFELDSLSRRKGSDMDAYRFKEIFKQLGFVVESKRNLTAGKMKSVMKQVSALCSSKHDALVVILLSHGTESGILGTDGLEVDMNDILTYFDNKKCKQMLGKPKVFIVQACRGQLTDYGVRDTQTFFSQPESQIFTQPSQFTQADVESRKISLWSAVDRNYHPTRTDMILCFSCQMGFVSTRNEDEGSWLGASLAAHLETEACRKHLIEILNMVSRDVRKRKSQDGYKQVLEITSIGFDRNLYFNPGLIGDN